VHCACASPLIVHISRIGKERMKSFFRIFFRGIRIALGPFMLLWEILTTPKGLVRSAEEQQLVDAQTRHLALYQFRTCPFCVRARREIKRLALKIELRDALHDPQHRAALQSGGGKIQVPCLRIGAGTEARWVYESDAIVRYLRERFAESNGAPAGDGKEITSPPRFVHGAGRPPTPSAVRPEKAPEADRP
jgi:glutaredoxin